MRRHLKALFSVTTLLAFFALASSSPAVTVETRPHLSSFDGSSSDAGSFQTIGGIAVHEGTGTIYVYDGRGGSNGVLDKFNSAGIAEDFSAIGSSSLGPFSFSGQVAVDNSGTATQGNFYVAEGNFLEGLTGYTPSGETTFHFKPESTTNDVAVDSAGRIWIAEYGSDAVRRFDPAGNPTGEEVSTSGNGQPVAVAIDSSDDLYIGTTQGIFKYSPTGTLIQQLSSTEPADLIVNSATGHLFALEGAGVVTEYDASGSQILSFGGGDLFQATGVAALAGSDRVLVTDGGDQEVHVFGPVATFTVADTTATAASDLAFYSATLNGTVDTLGVPTSFRFQYRVEGTADWEDTPIQNAGNTPGPQSVSAPIANLVNGTKYEFRILATNTDVGAQAVSNVETFETPIAPPPIATIQPVTGITATEAEFAGAVDPQGSPTQYRFEYATQADFSDAVSTSSESAGDGTGLVAVSASMSGLQPNMTYHVRLRAQSGGGDVTSAVEDFHTAAEAPFVRALPVGLPTDTTAWLGASVNPRNAATTYFVEYATDPGYADSISVPISEDAAAGSGGSFVLASQFVSGLEPGTTYYFRVVATSVAGTTMGETRSFTTRAEPLAPPSEGLPDGRVYERVSPSEKSGADIRSAARPSFSLTTVFQAAPSGNAVAYSSMGNFSGNGAPLEQQYVSRRDSSGKWHTEGLSPQTTPFPFDNFQPFYWLSEDLDQGILATRAPLVPGVPANHKSLYLRDNETGAYTRLSGGIPGATPDSWSIFQAATPSANAVAFLNVPDRFGGGDRWLWEWKDGQVREVGVLPDGTSVPSILASPTFEELNVGRNPISTDGDRLFFKSYGTRVLYLRDFSGSSPTTTLISGSERTGDDPTTPVEAFLDSRLEFASPDGSLAYFLYAAPLTDESTNATYSLYRWDGTAPLGSRLTDISAGDPQGSSQIDLGVLGGLGASLDLETLYFAANVKLTSGAVRGVPNIYRWSPSDGLALVASLDGLEDRQIWGWREADFGGEQFRQARVSENGRFLLFSSFANLTGYDTRGTRQTYLYDDREGSLTCVSCASFKQHSDASSSLIGVTGLETLNLDSPPRNISDDGQAIFNSDDDLVPADSNGVADVYRWRDGQIDLISSGSDPSPSRFVDASRSGGDVFFTSAEQLVPSDVDDLIDLYDARVGGVKEPHVDLPCTGDECQGTPSSPPTFQTPSSSGFAGVGNSPPTKAKRCNSNRRPVKVRGKVRCKRTRGKPAKHRSKARQDKQAKPPHGRDG